MAAVHQRLSGLDLNECPGLPGRGRRSDEGELGSGSGEQEVERSYRRQQRLDLLQKW